MTTAALPSVDIDLLLVKATGYSLYSFKSISGRRSFRNDCRKFPLS
jgi:hypothetical protein